MPTPTIGDNSISGDRLKSFIERLERLEATKAETAEDIKEVFAELKGVGYDAPTVRAIIKTRKKIRENAEKYHEQGELFDLYAAAIGMEV